MMKMKKTLSIMRMTMIMKAIRKTTITIRTMKITTIRTIIRTNLKEFAAI